MIILIGVITFMLGNVSMYLFMRGELDEAWSVARRTAAEKEHYRLAYEELRQKRGR